MVNFSVRQTSNIFHRSREQLCSMKKTDQMESLQQNGDRVFYKRDGYNKWERSGTVIADHF